MDKQQEGRVSRHGHGRGGDEMEKGEGKTNRQPIRK